MNKICLFSSYNNKDIIPNYTFFYLEILKKYFNRVVLITNININNENNDLLNEIGIEIMIVENEGLDFGMWYKGLLTISDDYDQIACINDSCILFNEISLKNILGWVDVNDLDYCGLTDSNQIGHDYHIQSYFIIFKRDAIKSIKNYYLNNGIINEDSRDIIDIYEIGLTQFLIRNGYKCGSYFSYKDFNNSNMNISLFNIEELISKGYPVIKKKLLKNSFRDHEIKYLISNNFKFLSIEEYRSIIFKEINKNVNNNLNLEYLLYEM